jgi:hypothetical protein
LRGQFHRPHRQWKSKQQSAETGWFNRKPHPSKDTKTCPTKRNGTSSRSSSPTREQYDAMQGAVMRSALAKAKKAAAEKQRKDADKATDAKGGGGPPPKKPVIKQPGDMTPEEEALSFDDPMMATG